MYEALITWLPLLVILGAFLLFARHAKNQQQKHVDEVIEINRELVALNREMVAELNQIKEILKDRK